MRRRERPLDPEVATGLAALDAALAGERPDREINLIAEEARAWAPPMTPAFAAALDHAVAAGFPKPAAAPARRRPNWAKWMPAAGLATAATVALLVVVADNGSDNHATNAVGGTRAAAPPQATAAPEAKSTDLAAPTGAGAELQAPAVQRRGERAAELTLTTPARKLQDTADGVVAVVDRVGGYVERSDVGQASGGGQATFELRVPTARLDATLAALSRLGHVQSRAQHSQDITAIFNAAPERLHDARAERDALLRALAKATTAEQTASLRARLRVVRSEIAAARGDLAAARRRADLARVSVTVVGRGGATGATRPGGGRWTPGDALRDAVHVLGTVAGVAIVTAAIALPLALLAGLAALAARALRRRRREAALDGGAPAV